MLKVAFCALFVCASMASPLWAADLPKSSASSQAAELSQAADASQPIKPRRVVSSRDLQQRAQWSCTQLLKYRIQQVRDWMLYRVPGHKGLTNLRYMATRRKILQNQPVPDQTTSPAQSASPDQATSLDAAAGADAFADHLWSSHDNATVNTGRLADMKGFSWRRAVLNDRRASANGSVFLPSYFKQHDAKQRKIWLAVKFLWSRPAQLTPEQKRETELAIQKVREWLEVFSSYRHNVNEAIRRGFQARLQAEALAQYKKQIYVEDFSQAQALKLDMPFLRYDNTSTKLVYKPMVFRDRMQMYGLQQRYHEEYRAKFGVPKHPVGALKDEALYYVEGLLAGLLSPVRFSVHVLKIIPLSLRSGAAFFHNIGLLLWSRVHEGGEIYKHMRAQAFYYRRLQTVVQALQARVDMRAVKLNAQEQHLVDDIQKALQDPELAPRSDAVRNLQTQIYKSETVLFFSRSLSVSNSLVFDRADDFMYLQEEAKISFVKQAWSWLRKHKLVAALGTTYILSYASGVGERAVFLIRDNPHIGHFTSTVKHNFHVFLDDALGKNITSRLELTQPDAASNFGFEKYTLASIVDEFFAYVREQRRIDPSYNYLTDVEYHKKLDKALGNLLALREEYSTSAQLAHAKHRLLHVVIPRKILNTMQVEFQQHWPNEVEALRPVFEAWLQSVPLGELQMMQHIVQQHQQGLSGALYRDLMYFAREGYAKAYTHYYDEQFGVLMSGEGDVYSAFASAP